MAGQQIAQVDHARPGVSGVSTVREPGQQLGKFGKGFLGVAGIALGGVCGDKAGEYILVARIGGEPLHVVGVIDAWMLWVKADKAVGSFYGGFVLIGTVVGIDQFELGLFSVFSEGIAGFQQLQGANSEVIIAVSLVPLCLLIHLLLAGIGGEFG